MPTADQNLELILFGWVDALRRRDPGRIADQLAEDIVWQGIRRDLVCPNRHAVLHNIADSGPIREQVSGIDVTVLDDQHVLLGVQAPGVTELFGEQLDGEIFDVFTIHDGIIVRIDEFKTRDEALAHARSRSTTQPEEDPRAADAPIPRRPRVDRRLPVAAGDSAAPLRIPQCDRRGSLADLTRCATNPHHPSLLTARPEALDSWDPTPGAGRRRTMTARH